MIKKISILTWCYIASIFFFSATGRMGLNIFRKYFDSETFLLLLVLALIAIILILIYRKHRLFTYQFMIGLACALLCAYLLKIPEEKFHILQYGLLGFLLKRDLVNYQTYLVLLIGILIGISDELFQLILPNRFGDFKDIVINAVGVGCGVMMRTSRPPSKI